MYSSSLDIAVVTDGELDAAGVETRFAGGWSLASTAASACSTALRFLVETVVTDGAARCLGQRPPNNYAGRGGGKKERCPMCSVQCTELKGNAGAAGKGRRKDVNGAGLRHTERRAWL